MNHVEEYDYDYPTHPDGWVHKDDLPSFNDTQDFIKGIMEVLYETGDVARLEDYVEELCSLYDIEFELKMPTIEKRNHPLMEFHLKNLKENKMNQEVVVKEQKMVEMTNPDTMMADIQNATKMCQTLMQYPHYKKLGSEGVFAIIQKAKSIGLNPLDALNGGMYFVQGKVELAAGTMNQMIRNFNHSITKDKRSNETICILHGKRADNGDTWVESFSIEDAKKAGIYRNQWIKYPKDMLFARALSRLARQLFPDVIKGCYVEGELAAPISEAQPCQIESDVNSCESDVNSWEEKTETISDEQYQELEDAMGNNLTLRQNILTFMKRKWGIETLHHMPIEIYDHALNRARQQHSPEMLGEENQLEA